MDQVDGRRRVVIEAVMPEVDGGRFDAKGSLGEPVVIEADVMADGHDLVRAVAGWREAGGQSGEVEMRATVNDRWTGEFMPRRAGRLEFWVEAWVDHFATWVHDLELRVEAGQDVEVELEDGARMVDAAAERDPRLARHAAAIRGRNGVRAALKPELVALMAQAADRSLATRSEPRGVLVERERARFSSWYELFPRSTSPDPARTGTLNDVLARVPEVAAMGFDILYLPPIHPIGRSFRKGRNNTVTAAPSDVGSPWAIGAREGGHASVARELGSVADLRRLARETRRQGLELALDIAFQCSPDHPWVKAHPEWFRHRSDGSIRYAENPPKKYQDIYPLNFESEDWRGLWDALRDVFLFWAERGVRVFRVDNPHTKAFPFWEWCIAQVRERFPDAIFLSEAFTRPKVMYRLAKLGFTQSYTYFAWRQHGWELREYMAELTRRPVVDFFRPSFWPNTPDILTEQLQRGGRSVSALRLLLAATMSASYGIYGPVFERVEVTAAVPGKEEYLDSEKYQVRHWDAAEPPLRDLVTRINAVRRSQPALQFNRWYRQLRTDNDALFAFAKEAPGHSAPVCVVVNLDGERRQGGWIELPVVADGAYDVVDVLNGPVYRWQGGEHWNYVEIDPSVTPGHVFRVGAELRPAEAT